MSAPGSALAGALLATAALALHVGLLAAAPYAATLVEAVREAPSASVAAARGAVATIRTGPWPMLAALLAREPQVAPGDAPLRLPALLAYAGFGAAAYLLVPSFATGMATAPLDDGVTVALLLAASLAAAMLGEAGGGRTGSIEGLAGGALGLALLPAALLPAMFALALAGGVGGLDAAIAAGPGQAPAPRLLVVAALCLAGAADLENCRAFDRSLAGRRLALFRAGSWARLMVWLDLIGALCPPRTLTDAAAGPVGWVVALAAWPVRVAVLAFLLGLAQRLLPLDRPDRRRAAWGASCLLALLASVLMLIGRRLA